MTDAREASARRMADAARRMADAISAHIRLLFEESNETVVFPERADEPKVTTLEQFNQQLKDLYVDKSPTAQSIIAGYIRKAGGVAMIPPKEYTNVINELKGLINER